MPTRPWKKTITADVLLSGLRSKGSSTLVVQTGFPTSLADLIVKNHDRLKKASRKNKKKCSCTSDLSTADGGASATRPPALGCGSSDPAIKNSTSAERSSGSVSGFWLLSGGLIILATLVIWKKKLVLWITISAFFLLLLELYGLRGWGFLKGLEARKMVDSVFDSFVIRRRESASRIREISAGFQPGSSVSDGNHEESRILDQSSELFVESHDLPEVCRKRNLKLLVNTKAKKLLRKFILSKNHVDIKDGRIPHCVKATLEGLSEKDFFRKGEEEGNRDDEVQSFKAVFGDLRDGKEKYRFHCIVDGIKVGRYSQLVFFLIVLCGLLRGKTVALLLALAWCFFFKFIQVLRNKGRMA